MVESHTPCHSPARAARREDLAALVALYNYYVLTSHCTFDIEPFTEQSRIPWWSIFDGVRYQCLVVEENDGLVGYACSTPLKSKTAYATSVEVSVYIAADEGGKGFGRRLYAALFAQLAEVDVHRAYALIALPNEPSLALHEAFDFRQVSQLTEVGRKFDRYWDVAWLERCF